MLRRFAQKDFTSVFFGRTSLRFFSADTFTASAFDASSRAKYVKQQRQQANIDEVLGASSRRTVYKSTERAQPCLYSFYEISPLTKTIKFEPDSKWDQDSFETRVFNEFPTLIGGLQKLIDRSGIYIQAWVKREADRILKGVELTPQKQKKFEELMTKMLDINPKDFNKEAPRFLKQIEDLTK